ncbi:MAG: anthranilate synthase component I family protein [Chitinophagales bacterium]
MLNWANQFDIFCFLDNHGYQQAHHTHECLLAAGSLHEVESNSGKAFTALRDFSDKHKDWIFGHFSYDLKNEIESLHSSHPDHIGFPDLSFFVPEFLIELNEDSIRIGSCNSDHLKVCTEILNPRIYSGQNANSIEVKQRFSRKEYVEAVEQLQAHILFGDCYEINFCQEFFSEHAIIDPLFTYELLSKASPMPFGALYKRNHHFLLCASPERYLKKKGGRIISQPIKGTASRNLEHAILDDELKEALFRSPKDRSENIMIVDLVRNDLSRICEEGSVSVDELFGIYSFPFVHQMISSVSGILSPDVHWTDAVKATFPMGSMTGAPKKKALEIIEQYEKTKRGLFSGALGYCSTDGDFDFNVVIRSILYNQQNQYLSFQAGSAITFYSDPDKEYEECLVKASAISNVLANKKP